MMNIYISTSFLKENNIKITWADVLWGLDNKVFSAKEIVNYAIDEIEFTNDELVLELASLSNNELEEVNIILNKILQKVFIKDVTLSKRKWLFIVLFWLYQNKDKIENSLDVVEVIYADFDYPEIIKSFVKYMPNDEPSYPTREQNIKRLFENWKKYLENEKSRFLKS